MNKRGLLGLIIILLAALIVGFFLFVKFYYGSENIISECSVDSDCVPDSCCHPSSCTAVSNAPKCEGTFCTAECVPGTLDCGQGSCGCVEGKCVARFE